MPHHSRLLVTSSAVVLAGSAAFACGPVELEGSSQGSQTEDTAWLRVGTTERYEAEQNDSAVNCRARSNHSGFTGTGFMDYGGAGSFVEWRDIQGPDAGEFELLFRYANGSSGPRRAEVIVNGARAGEARFAPTGGWSRWSSETLRVSLRAGRNTLRVRASTGAGGPNLDHFVVAAIDLCPDDPAKDAPGECGCGTPDGDCGGDDAGTPEPQPQPQPQNLTLTAEADAYVDSSAPNGNFGTSAQLLVDNDPIGYETLLRFRVPTLTAPVRRAVLRLTVTNPTGDGPKIFRTSDSWGERSVTWNSRPAPQGGAIADLGRVNTGVLEVDVTSAITRAGTYSFLLRPDATDGLDLESREGAGAPQLRVLTGDDDDSTGGGSISHVGTTEVYDSNGQGLRIARPSGSRAGDLLVLILHRTDDDLPLEVAGWRRVAECYKRDNGYDCSTAADCTQWRDDRFCARFGDYGQAGRDLAQSVFVRTVRSDEPNAYTFNLNRDTSGHPGWAILTALRGADTEDPVRDWSNEGCDRSADSLFPSVYGEAGDMLLLSQSFDDAIAQAKFGAPEGTRDFGYVSRSDEAGFLFGGVLTRSGETGVRRTRGDGGPACKDALVSLTIRPR